MKEDLVKAFLQWVNQQHTQNRCTFSLADPQLTRQRLFRLWHFSWGGHFLTFLREGPILLTSGPAHL
jgi:hypothetical protein